MHAGPALVLSLGLGLLAGCGTPWEQCLARAGAELDRLETERAERQANLERGHARVRRAAEPCFSAATGLPVPCGPLRGGWEWDIEPISRTAEARRIAQLDARIAQARPLAETARAACRAQFPQG